MNKIFAIFLDKLSKTVTKAFYKEFALLIALYRQALNEIGWDKLTKKLSDLSVLPENYKEKEYCEVNNGEYAPEICNEFACELLPKYLL
jgi:hypothetical protein